ncbi:MULTISPECIES: PH domain-containing protein [unclassified Nocardia]|uniref:PH domain-containing protein n=1 Tax=unclassified Nocardia TaxID=2637762 RepID=UPI0024A7C1FE|nr:MULTISPECIES: PH domain-containing protein [unclassified Nocardia]
MAYPEEALAPDEQLLLHRHPHWKMLFLPAVAFIFVTALAGFGFGLASRAPLGILRTGFMIAVPVAWVLLVIWWCIVPLIAWRTTHFIVTDRRVLVREGVLTHTGIDIPMTRISSVQFSHGLTDRLLGAGTLTITSASEEPLEFTDIPRVQQVHGLVYHQVFDVVQQDPRDGNGR